jgi:hypothetical protein
MEKPKTEEQAIEHVAMVPEEIDDTVIMKGNAPVMRTAEDDLSIWQGVRRYKLATALAMIAAFSASLDGYRKMPLQPNVEFSDRDFLC